MALLGDGYCASSSNCEIEGDRETAAKPAAATDTDKGAPIALVSTSCQAAACIAATMAAGSFATTGHADPNAGEPTGDVNCAWSKAKLVAEAVGPHTTADCVNWRGRANCWPAQDGASATLGNGDAYPSILINGDRWPEADGGKMDAYTGCLGVGEGERCISTCLELRLGDPCGIGFGDAGCELPTTPDPIPEIEVTDGKRCGDFREDWNP